MADSKISALVAAVAAEGDEFVINEAGTTKRLPARLMRAWLGNTQRNQSIDDQLPAAGATTYVEQSQINVPAGKLRIGTFFRWTLTATKTAAGTAARSILIKLGRGGNTGDATIVTLTSSAPTAATDTALFRVTLIIRGPLSASCVANGAYAFIHFQSNSGFNANEVEVVQATSGTFDATVPELICGLALSMGASEAITIQQIVTEAYNL